MIIRKNIKSSTFRPKSPASRDIPAMNYAAVRGKGNPNDPDGEYKRAMSLLYGISFTIKMSYKGSHRIEGYFPYVVPPLEGLWRQDGITGIDYSHKDSFQWISMIRLPEFVTKEEFDWAVQEAEEKKQTDFSRTEFFTYNEGLCVQCMHIGSYDDEPATLRKMEAFLSENGYQPDFSGERLHHEIYLSDPRRTAPERLKTVIRQPIKRI